MPYLVGLVLSIGVAAMARVVGLDRDRAFYSTVLMVVASYYVLFAAMSGSMDTVLLESVVTTGFVIVAITGFKSSTWILAAGLAGHGIFDGFHGYLVENSGMPVWWPPFCLAYDIGAAFCLAWLTKRDSAPEAAAVV